MATSKIKKEQFLYEPGAHGANGGVYLGHCPGMSGGTSKTLSFTATLPYFIPANSTVTIDKLWLNLRSGGSTVENFDISSLSNPNGIDLTTTYKATITKLNTSSTQKVMISLEKRDGSIFSNLQGSEPICPNVYMAFTTT